MRPHGASMHRWDAAARAHPSRRDVGRGEVTITGGGTRRFRSVGKRLRPRGGGRDPASASRGGAGSEGRRRRRSSGRGGVSRRASSTRRVRRAGSAPPGSRKPSVAWVFPLRRDFRCRG
jgi:hypothetical protein